MPDLTAKRTLVKSPPELWEELSEVERLAKHLGAFGEITITKLEPEHTVAWEGERASGTVSIEPSGWGTKVTLRAELPEPEPEPAPAEPEPAPAEPEPAAAAPPGEEAQHVDDQIRRFRVELEPPAEVEVEVDSDEEVSELAPRRGFWGWLFRKRTASSASAPKPVADEPQPDSEPLVNEPEPEPLAAEPTSVPVVDEPATVAVAAEPEPDAAPHPLDDQPEGPGAGAALDPERARVILDEALDTLGAAHHRPFSRG